MGRIDTIEIDPAYQKKGTAFLLMQEMLDYMEQVRANTLYPLINRLDWDLLQCFDAMGLRRGDMINLEFKMED
ncbi:MAG: hypothetical protein DRG87_00560 [Deltaproteobacteria bacterium]|nr:GNAT family N-acetyltransferase [Deltaproteobacteria bacterium]RLB32105.1 MAG: hypothetical protein DRG87_00560 [Deltaproteobacteria bacterium]